MRSAKRGSKVWQPDNWDDIPSNQKLQDTIDKHYYELSSQMFGYHLVKIGPLSATSSTANCPIRHQNSFAHKFSDAGIRGDITEFPFQDNAIDGFVLTLALDFSRDPHQVLREVDRCITPNGMVLLCGFNPLSLSGVARYTPWYRRQHPIKAARFFTCARVKDWLQLLHYDIVTTEYGYYSSVFGQLKIPYTQRLQEAISNGLRRYLPGCGSLYFILAKKRTIPMTIVRQKWRTKPRFVPAQATPRVISPSSRPEHLREVQE